MARHSATLAYLGGRLQINREEHPEVKTWRWEKPLSLSRWVAFFKFVFFCSFIIFFLPTPPPPRPPPNPHPASTSSEVGANEWRSRSRLLSGYKIPSSSPPFLRFSTFEVELLYNWARRVCRLLRLLHLKFGSPVTPPETWRTLHDSAE